MSKINVISVTNKLTAEPELIITILTRLNFEGIRDRGKYIQFMNKGGNNPAGCSIRKEDLMYQNFSHGGKGNIYTLVMDDRHCSFPEALTFICNTIGLKNTTSIIKYPFHGFYKDITKLDSEPESTLKTYKESDLPTADSLPLKWFREGVDFKTMEQFGVRYDHNTDGIIIPEYSFDGALVGAKWRNNKADCTMDERWGMYIPFSKSYTIYGWKENYQSILQKKKAIIVEAEKSVLQAKTFGCNIVLAVGGHDLSETQCKYIRSLLCDQIIVAFDEGLQQDEIEYQAKKLIVDNQLISNQVGYVYDNSHDVLIQDSKNSPTDQGKDAFSKLIKEHVTWVRK